MTARPPLPPFDSDTATLKARMAEDAWNSRDPQQMGPWQGLGPRLSSPGAPV